MRGVSTDRCVSVLIALGVRISAIKGQNDNRADERGLTVEPGILRQDEHLVWVDKRSGLLSVPGRTAENQDCVVARLQRTVGWAREVHRLDRDTSGVMLLARDVATHRDLCRQFREKTTRKAYIAVTMGLIAEDRGEIDLPIRADIARRPLQIVDDALGKPALTRFEVLRREPAAEGCSHGQTRLLLRPETGRTHQLRVHLASIGHSILGDSLYAGADVLAMSPRLLLHALWLEINHPRTGMRIRVESDCPF